MIEKYLEKLYQEYYEKKLNLEQENQRLIVNLNNSMRLTETIRESLDEDFETFFPRKVDQQKHMEIDSLTEEQKVITEKIDKLQIKIKNIDIRMEEIEELLKNLREDQGHIDVPLKQDDNKKEDLICNFKSIENKVEICIKLVDIDTIRCKLELQMIDNIVKKMIQEWNTPL